MAIEKLGRNTAKVAVRILHGEPAGSIKTPVQGPGMPVYDWRELKRWQISETRLPSGSVVRFRQLTAWEQYKWRILGVLALCLLEALLIVVLLSNLVRRRRVEQTLRDSEERLRLATAAADIGVWAWDIYDNRIWVSENWSRMFRIPVGADIGFETLLERVHPDDRELVQQAVKRAIEQKVDYTVEYRIALPDGTRRWIAARGRLNPGGNVKHDRLVGVSVDITDRKRAIKSVRRLQEQNELILTSAAEGILGLDLQGNHTFVNPAAAQMLGYTPEELLRRHGHSTWHHTRADGSPYPDEECLICGVFRTGKVRRASNEVFWRKDGTSFPAEYTGTPIYQQGQLVGAVVTFQDITERKQAETALHESQTTLNAIIESTDDLIWSVDSVSFGLMTFNRGLRDYFFHGRGIRIERGMRPEDLFPPGEYVQRWRDFYRRALEEGPFTVEYLVYTQDRTLQLSFNVLKRDGEVFGVSAFGKDITERKRAELEVQQQRQELAHVARVSVMGELAASVAHELNQPLGAILSNAEAAELFLAQDPPAVDELRDILADIRKDDERAGEVIHRMRALLRKRELEKEPLAGQFAGGRCISAGERRRRIAQDDDWRRIVAVFAAVEGDRIHLQQVLLNLVMNAMEAMAKQPPEKRRLMVRTRRASDGGVEVSVADSGHGIEPADLPRIFEPFFTTKQSGIGMGLAIARKMVEAHHGRIWAENHPAGGAVFRVTLPAPEGKDSNQ